MTVYVSGGYMTVRVSGGYMTVHVSGGYMTDMLIYFIYDCVFIILSSTA